MLPARPDVAAATLRALAAIQGTREDVTWDEEPGKIVHEVRPGISVARQGYLGLEVPDGELRYYGSADATPLFLHVLATTGDAALAAELEPAGARPATGCWARWSAAAACCAGTGARRAGSSSRAGATRSTRSARTGSPSQGSGILHEDGSVPEPPVADADTQAAALAGLRGLARLSGDAAHADAVDALAARIGAAWDPETMALDAHDRPVRGAGSQLGWLLWAGAPVAGAAERLSAARRAHRLRAAHAVGPPPAASTRSPTTAARSGRSTRGWAGAGCAPPGTPRPPSACARACSRASSGSGTTPSSTR